MFVVSDSFMKKLYAQTKNRCISTTVLMVNMNINIVVKDQTCFTLCITLNVNSQNTFSKHSLLLTLDAQKNAILLFYENSDEKVLLGHVHKTLYAFLKKNLFSYFVLYSFIFEKKGFSYRFHTFFELSKQYTIIGINYNYLLCIRKHLMRHEYEYKNAVNFKTRFSYVFVNDYFWSLYCENTKLFLIKIHFTIISSIKLKRRA